jgi:hypothetical protein
MIPLDSNLQLREEESTAEELFGHAPRSSGRV